MKGESWAWGAVGGGDGLSAEGAEGSSSFGYFRSQWTAVSRAQSCSLGQIKSSFLGLLE